MTHPWSSGHNEAYAERRFRHIVFGGQELVCMLEAYLDESGTQAGSPGMCVAGYLFEPAQRRALDLEWSQALAEAGVSCFHMSDCVQGVRAFKVLPNEQRKELIRTLIGILKERMTWGCAVALNEHSQPQNSRRRSSFEEAQEPTSPSVCSAHFFLLSSVFSSSLAWPFLLPTSISSLEMNWRTTSSKQSASLFSILFSIQ